MGGTVLDEVDRRIVHALQRDARNSTTTALAEELGVAASTVSNRIAQLEDDGIVTGYHATIDYERAGLPLHVLVTGTAPITDRARICREALTIPGVVSVRELMSGEQNVEVEAVARSSDEHTRIASELVSIGLRIHEERMIRMHHQGSLSTLVEEPPSSQSSDQ
ncbi:Lrp/AsnC family transcriptional regulator [Halorarius litoreus]|uniref:Lrp/AsnC family transcriptional regulator n=1 Tax=Halorarius litoreus TaxID=2962676 RepID=UPI0020CD5291|nr:Lrp/AsnC family transcriptional regulator [Halorarius litoreus]